MNTFDGGLRWRTRTGMGTRLARIHLKRRRAWRVIAHTAPRRQVREEGSIAIAPSGQPSLSW